MTALSVVAGFGGPNAAAPGGGTASSTQALVPGDYLMICFIPSPSDGVPHEATFYALADGATLDDALAFFAGEGPAGPPPVTPAGGLAAVAGQRSVDAYVNLDLSPGEYALVCFLPDTAGDGAPHFTKGMALQISIT